MHKGLADSFSLYRSKSKDTGSVSKSDYIKIAYLFIQFMMKKVIYDEVLKIHISRFPYNDFLFEYYDNEDDVEDEK